MACALYGGEVHPGWSVCRAGRVPALALGLGLALMGAPACALASETGQDTPAWESARALVERQHLGAGLGRMAQATATGTLTYSMLTERLGSRKASETVAREIERLVPQYQQAWDRELVQAYARHFSPQELVSLAEQGRASPYVRQLASKQPAVGAEMHAMAASIVRDLVSEALRSAWSGLPAAAPP